MPERPFVKLFEATLTAWSECVPVPKACVTIIALPKRRGMKKSEMSLTRLAAHTPMTVIPTRYTPSTARST